MWRTRASLGPLMPRAPAHPSQWSLPWDTLLAAGSVLRVRAVARAHLLCWGLDSSSGAWAHMTGACGCTSRQEATGSTSLLRLRLLKQQ